MSGPLASELSELSGYSADQMRVANALDASKGKQWPFCLANLQ